MEIIELQLLSGDLKKTEDFYTHTLGLPLAAQTPLTISFTAGNTRLTFMKSDGQFPYYHFAFNIPVNQLDEAFEFISAKIPVIEVTPGSKIADFDTWNARSFYFFDPNGNILEFIVRYGLEKNSAHPFTGTSILGVSEIGIPVKDVVSLSEQMKSACQLEYFSRQPVKNNFAAIGDDHGLLIFVEEGRNWYPTNEPAKPFKSKIKIRHQEEVHEIQVGEG